MASKAVVVQVDLHDRLAKVSSGKVRDLFAIDDRTLLFVASDRISAFDVVMENGIPEKGALLTAMSIYWFKYLQWKIPDLQTHFLSAAFPQDLRSSLPALLVESLQPRSMQVRRLEVFALESIVRGYITGSGWAEYKKSGTMNGIHMPAGLLEGQKLDYPLWTPSTKAEVGEHDENISPLKAAELIGEDYAKEIERLSLEIYTIAAHRAEEVGIILADTKFEFGLDKDNGNKVVLIDEVLTPDSSRFWPKETWRQNLGKTQPSFDKQGLRDWLIASGLKGKRATIPENVVTDTAARYREAYEKITGENWKKL